MERLDKLIASQGKYSRKEVKQLVARRRVTVDGVSVKSADVKIDETAAVIAIDGIPLTIKKHLYLMLNKPKGYVSSTEGHDGAYVLELVPTGRSEGRVRFPMETR